MKKFILFITIALSALSMALCVGCARGNDSGGKKDNAKDSENGRISLSVASADMIFGDKLDIICFYGGNDTVKWTSSDESVATVDNDGSVSTVGIGECKITAEADGGSATCDVSVSMGDYLPELKVLHIKDDELVLRVGDNFEPEVKVLFNKVYYDCEIGITTSKDGVIGYADGKIAAKTEGEVSATFTGEWQNFTADRLNKEIRIKVIENVEYNNKIVIDGNAVDSSAVEISVVAEWQGETYPNVAEVDSSVTINGSDYACEFTAENEDLLNLKKIADGKVKIGANGIGDTFLTAKYVGENGRVYETKIAVTVYCPTAVYDGQLDFCASKPIDVASVFGTQYARILSVTQGNKTLKSEMNYIEGVKIAGDETEPMTILTNVGGYVFENVFGYDVELTKDNIFETLLLGRGDLIKKGYYILNSDITEAIDFTSQAKCAYKDGDAGNTYFCGTFDGRGHIFSAKVGENGVFGGLFNGAVIKNTEFIFEFSDKSSSCGLASNEATFNHQKGAVKLNNIAVKTKNYYLNSYALFAYCNFNLEMQDVYVNISGTEKLPDYTGVTTEMAALFHYDLTATMASNDGKFKGGFRNIFVVTGKFMPMACSKWRYSGYTYVSYAKNDEAHLGNFKPTGYDHLYTYCHVVADEDNDPQTLAYYGMLLYGGSAPRPFAWIFKARADITDGGIERYDTAFELSKKTDKIGDWNVT